MKVLLKTAHPVAADSVDHRYPLGTAKDNFHWPPFTRKLIQLYGGDPIKVLDLGCAGGGFVKEVLDFGHFAVGLEGSDYSLKHRRAEWSTIPEHLFTCDCSQPFEVIFEIDGTQRPARFEVVTAWELLEHLTEEQLPQFFANVKRHLDPERGLFVASVHLHSCLINGVEYHPTVRPEWWWRDFLRRSGFFLLDRALDYFDEDWVRGPLQNAPGSFHVVAALAHDNWIARQVDQAAAGEFPHGRVQRVELKQTVRQLREALESVTQELSRLRSRLEVLQTERDELWRENPSFCEENARLATFLEEVDAALGHRFSGMQELRRTGLKLLCVHALLAVEECCRRRVSTVAFFGVGTHSALLLPLWISLGGPRVQAFLATRPNSRSFHGIPVVPVGAPLPASIEAVVPSSHRYEEEMRRIFSRHYPHLTWIPFWQRHPNASAEDQDD